MMRSSKKSYKDELNIRVYDFAVAIMRFVRRLPKDAATQVLARQLVRSGTSVAANLMEAQAASSKKDYINFYTHALKSANESKLWLQLIRDTVNDVKPDAEELLEEAVEIAKILAASVITMKRNT